MHAVPKMSLFFESKRLEEMIRECYQLYPERTKGCKRPETSITLIPFPKIYRLSVSKGEKHFNWA